MEIPVKAMAPWKGAVVGNEVDDAVKKMAHVALTALCERHLIDTADMPIALFPIHNQEEPEWRLCREVVCDLTSPHFSAGWVQMAKYTRYLFNLQHNTGRIIIEQCACLYAYTKQATSRHTRWRGWRERTPSSVIGHMSL
jgi:hypothetical protein